MVWLEWAGACSTVLTVLTSINSQSTRAELGLNSRMTAASTSTTMSHCGGKRLYSKA